MPRRYIVNRSDAAAAKRIRETFVDRPVRKTIPIHWSWPKKMHGVGQCEAVQYTSDKWRDEGDYQDYKHVAEGPQRLYVKPDLLHEYGKRKRLDCAYEVVELPRKMPTVIAELAPALGFQFQSYIEPEGDDDELELSGIYYHTKIERAYVGAAVMPGTGEVFLMMYTKSELCAIITGDILNVEKDGIVG